MSDNDKVYFQPGNVVTLKQDLANKPEMMVVQKKQMLIRPKDAETSSCFMGILCRWFTKDQQLQEAVFNTKDLVKL